MSVYGRIRRNILTGREDIFQTRTHSLSLGQMRTASTMVASLVGGKINGAWMSGFTVPGDKRHMHFAHHKEEKWPTS